MTIRQLACVIWLSDLNFHFLFIFSIGKSVKATNLVQKINLFHNFILKLYFLYMKVKCCNWKELVFLNFAFHFLNICNMITNNINMEYQ